MSDIRSLQCSLFVRDVSLSTWPEVWASTSALLWRSGEWTRWGWSPLSERPSLTVLPWIQPRLSPLVFSTLSVWQLQVSGFFLLWLFFFFIRNKIKIQWIIVYSSTSFQSFCAMSSYSSERKKKMYGGALRPQKPYSLLGTGEGWKRSWKPRPTSLFTLGVGASFVELYVHRNLMVY